MTKPKTSDTLGLSASSSGNIWICWLAQKSDKFFLTTINCCSVRGKRGVFRRKREWCWTRTGGRISRGWKLSLQHLESAELQATDREKNSGGGGFSACGGCKQFRTRHESCKVEEKGHIWCLFAFQDFLICSTCIFGIFYNLPLSQPWKSLKAKLMSSSFTLWQRWIRQFFSTKFWQDYIITCIFFSWEWYLSRKRCR